MNSQSIEFDKTHKDPALYKIVRKSFRIPVEDSGKNWVRIENHQYPIQDICLDGIGITLENPTLFTVSQIVMDCEMNVAGQKITGLNGRVIHFSLNSGEDWQYGVQWIAMPDESQQKMTDVVAKLKKEFFMDDHQTD